MGEGTPAMHAPGTLQLTAPPRTLSDVRHLFPTVKSPASAYTWKNGSTSHVSTWGRPHGRWLGKSALGQGNGWRRELLGVVSRRRENNTHNVPAVLVNSSFQPATAGAAAGVTAAGATAAAAAATPAVDAANCCRSLSGADLRHPHATCMGVSPHADDHTDQERRTSSPHPPT